MPLLEVIRLSKSYPRAGGPPSVVVEDVSFAIAAGQTLGLVGESGSGKSTIARMTLGLLAPTSGTVLFNEQRVNGAPGRVLRSMRRQMQPVFQDPFAALNPRMRVEEILAEPFLIHKPEGALSTKHIKAACTELLRIVGLDESALPRYPHEFSGGQRQRINIARALALRPQLLVLDEPISALDVSVGAQVVNLLRDLQREFGLAYLFITHSMPLVRYLATEIAVLEGGRLVELGPAETIVNSPRDPYTRRLMAATPMLRD